MANYHHKHTLLSLIIILLLAFTVHTAKPKQKGLIPSTAGTFKTNSSEQILLYFDLDRDGQVDIVTKSISRTDTTSMSINVYIWNNLRKQYYPSGQFPIPDYASLKTAFVSSFNVSPKLILVTYYQDTTGQAKIVSQFIACTNYNCTLDDPMVIPQISTGKNDLYLGLDPINPTLFTIQGEIMLVYHAGGVAKLLFFGQNYKYTIFNFSQKINGALVSDFQQSYIGDYNGDCLADLILLSQSDDKAIFQFLTGDIYNYYTVRTMFTLDEKVHHFTIQDINFDGKNDFVILLHNGDIQIHYNTNTNSTLCHPVDSPYDFQVDETTPKQIQRLSFGKKLYSSSVLLFSDYNNDGYEDLTLTFVDEVSSLPSAVLLKNIQCFDAQCGTFNPSFVKQSLTLNLRTFQIVTIPGLPSVSIRMSFLDINDDGNSDLFVQSQFSDANGRYIALQPVYNTYDFDAFFIKMTILARRTFEEELSNTECVGGSASVYVTLLSGQLAPRTANQMTQIGKKLQVPRVRFGLGRTNNYLQNLVVKIPRKIEDTSVIQFSWSPIIPNSNLLIIPPPTRDFQYVKKEWVLKMIIEPTEKISLVAFLVVISLAVVGIMILHLTKKQKEEDKQNQQSFYTLLR